MTLVKLINFLNIELIILNYLYTYETKLKDMPLQSQIGLNMGLLGLIAGYERIRGVSGFDSLDLNLANEIYLETRQ